MLNYVPCSLSSANTPSPSSWLPIHSGSHLRLCTSVHPTRKMAEIQNTEMNKGKSLSSRKCLLIFLGHTKGSINVCFGPCSLFRQDYYTTCVNPASCYLFTQIPWTFFIVTITLQLSHDQSTWFYKEKSCSFSAAWGSTNLPSLAESWTSLEEYNLLKNEILVGKMNLDIAWSSWEPPLKKKS